MQRNLIRVIMNTVHAILRQTSDDSTGAFIPVFRSELRSEESDMKNKKLEIHFIRIFCNYSVIEIT